MNPEHHSSDRTSEPSYRYNSIAFFAGLALLLIFLLAACTSTSIEEPNAPASETSDLIVTISPGDSYTFPTNRADADIHAGHKLRYIASLYRSTNGSSMTIENKSASKPTGNRVQRIEILASESNQVIFRNVDPDKYFIKIFADYIDETAQPNPTSGKYADKYYDTNTEIDGVSLIGNPTFNNHNLDCFLGGSNNPFEKQANKPLTFDYTLNRVVSQVQIVSDGNGNDNALDNITIKQSSVIKGLKYDAGETFGTLTNKRNTTITRAQSTANPNLLFFFYTFEAPSTNSPLGETMFTLNPKEGYTFQKRDYTISDSPQITPKANYIYKVVGSFLNVTDVPAKTTSLNISVSQDWSDSSQDLTD